MVQHEVFARSIQPREKSSYLLLHWISFHVLLRASVALLWAMLHLFQTINLQSLKNLVLFLCFEILYGGV